MICAKLLDDTIFAFCELEVKLEIRSEVRSEVKDKTIAIDPRHFAVPTKALPFSS